MADFEKVYSIKFNINSAITSLDRLEKKIKDIKKSGLIGYLNGVRVALNRVDNYAKKAGDSLKRSTGREAQRNLKALGGAGRQAAAGLKTIPLAARSVDLSLSTIGRNMSRWILAPLAAISAASIKAAFDINKGMANISTLTSQTPEQLRAMRTEVQGLMIDLGKGSQDLTDGLYQVISALGESSENVGQLEGAARAAVAGLSDTKSSVEMLTAVAKAYNDTSAKSIKHTSDLAFQTVKLGVTTFPELAASIGKVAPLAAQFNTSQEELFGTMATLTGVTGDTAEVVTQLASVYTAFMKPSEDMEDAIRRINKENKEYNFQNAGAMLKTLGFKKTIELLGKAAGGSEEKLMGMFRRKEAILGILPLISSQSENYTKKVNEMANATGATDEAFRKQTEGINKTGHSFEQTEKRVIVFAQNIGEKLLPTLNRMLDTGDKIIKWLEGMDEQSIETAISIAKVAVEMTIAVNVLRGISAIGGATISILGGIGATASGSVAGVAALSAAMNSLLVWIGLAIAAYKALKFASEEWDRRSQPKVEERQNKISRESAKVDERLKTMSTSELEEASRTEQEIISSLPTSDFEANFESRDKFMQMWHSDFSDNVERPIEQAQREREEAIARKSKIDAQLKRRRAEDEISELTGLGSQRGGGGFDWLNMGGQAASGGAGGVNINMPTTVTAGGLNEQQARRIVEKNQRDFARKTQQDIEAATAGTRIR